MREPLSWDDHVDHMSWDVRTPFSQTNGHQTKGKNKNTPNELIEKTYIRILASQGLIDENIPV